MRPPSPHRRPSIAFAARACGTIGSRSLAAAQTVPRRGRLLPSGNLGGAARRATSCGLVNSFSSRPLPLPLPPSTGKSEKRIHDSLKGSTGLLVGGGRRCTDRYWGTVAGSTASECPPCGPLTAEGAGLGLNRQLARPFKLPGGGHVEITSEMIEAGLRALWTAGLVED
jgi:hypothetical protein